MPFSDLHGNGVAKTMLERMLSFQRMPHALLFSGPEGVGKLTFAKRLAGEIFGEEHAFKIEKESHCDFHVYRPDGKGQLHTIDSIRDLKEALYFSPLEAPAKVFVIESAEAMMPSASNALLKGLEEPPPGNFLILLSHNPEKIIPTISSRCQKVPFFPLKNEEITHFVENKLEKSPAESKRIALLSEGSFARARELSSLTMEKEEKILLDLLSQGRNLFYPTLIDSLATCEILLDKEEDLTLYKKNIHFLLKVILTWCRDLILLAEQKEKKEELFYSEHLTSLSEIAKEFHFSLVDVLHWIGEAEEALERNIKPRIVFQQLFTKLFLERN